MTEKEKMLAHQMYDANYNKELHDERIAAKELCLILCLFFACDYYKIMIKFSQHIL